MERVSHQEVGRMTLLGIFFQLGSEKLSSIEKEACVIKLNYLRVAPYFAFRVRNVDIFVYNQLQSSNLWKAGYHRALFPHIR